MAGKKKGVKGKKAKGQAKKIVDENQLRRDLRDQAKMWESTEPAEEAVPAEDVSQYFENIRIGGIEG